MAFTAQVIFDTQPQSPNKGKIGFYFNETTVAADSWEIYVTVISPDAATIQEAADFSGAGDVTMAFGGSGSLLVDIPLDSNGNYMAGGYNIQIWRKLVPVVGDPEGVVAICDTLYTFCPHNTPNSTANDKISTSETLSCITGLLTGNDITDYDALGLTIDGRTLTITPPAIDGRDAVTSGDANANVDITVAYSNLEYPITYDIIYFYDEVEAFSDPVVTIQSWAGVLKVVNYLVDCGGNLCSTLDCFKTYMDSLAAKAIAAGGWHRLSSALLGNYSLIQGYLTLAFGYKSCGNTTQQIAAIEAAKALLGDCGCNCTDCNSTDPIPFVPAE